MTGSKGTVMNALTRLNDLLARGLAPLADLVALAIRVHVGWQFRKSGLLKLQDWSTTLYLFENEYRVPVLSPHAAAFAGTTGELLFPVLLFLGLGGRLGALGMSAVNAMAVIAYAHVLLQDGFEAAIGQHVLWAWLLVVIAVHGPGRLSIDRWLARRHAPAGRY